MGIDHDRLESILVNALEIDSEAERQRYLEQTCADDLTLKHQVEQLIANHLQAGDFLDVADQPTSRPSDATNTRDATIGPYRVLQKIGEGGMGIVYLAEQDQPFRRQVALKVLRADMDSSQVVTRFEQERQALALMNHPNIARVIDGGLTNDGRPYFAMELIQGLPITTYCDQHRLTLRQRLKLFIPVCLAVEHAHQKSIIHRDLKPSNVLVTEADGKHVPIVIDFGVAKAVGARLNAQTLNTHLGSIIGTLEYMSPEQAVPDQEDIDTRSDIYCLGVMLYELLTGTTPLQRQRGKDVAVLELLQIIREVDPPTPSSRLSSIDEVATVAASRSAEPKTLSHGIKGDLDWIVMKCLEKARNRRYSAASGIARDIERFLNDEPIEAGPPGTAYRMRKFLWRNRWAATVLTVLFLTLVAGVVGTSIGLVQAARGQAAANQALQVSQEQRDRAERHYQHAMSAVDRLLTRVGGARLESVPLMDDTRRQLLQDALEFYRKLLDEESDDPLARREVGLAWQRMGVIQGKLGDPQTEESLQRAIEIQRTLIREFPDNAQHNEDYIRSRRHLAFELFRLGRWQDAERIVADTLSDDPVDSNDAIFEQVLLNYLNAALCAATGKHDQAISASKASLQLADELVKRDPSTSGHQMERARILAYLGNLYREDRRFEEAHQCFQDGRVALNGLLSESTPDPTAQFCLAAICNNQGLNYANQEQHDQAMAMYREAIAVSTQLADDHPGLPDYKWQLAKHYNNLALEYSAIDDPARAAVENEKFIALFYDLMQSYPRRLEFSCSYAGGCANQGKYLGQLDRWEESIVWNSKAIVGADRALAMEPRHAEAKRFVHGALMGRAGGYRHLKQFDMAQADYRRSLELSEGERHPNYVNFRPRALAYVGETEQAASAAEAIVSNPKATAFNFSEMAKVFATCAEVTAKDQTRDKAERTNQSNRYAIRCVELLSRAAEKGRFPALEDVNDLRTDDRLQFMLDREDFQQLLVDLEKSIRAEK